MNEDEMSGPADEEDAFDDPAYADDLEDHASHNLQALVAATMAFLGERQIPTGAWTTFLGERFARDWETDERLDPEAFLDGMLTNLQTLGAVVVETDFTSRPVTATLTGFPDPEICAAFDVPVATVVSYLDTASAAAARHGLGWSWRLDGERLVVSVAGTS